MITKGFLCMILLELTLYSKSVPKLKNLDDLPQIDV